MSTMNVSLPDEMRDFVQHYNEHRPTAAARFIDELEATFRRIGRNPGIGDLPALLADH